MPSDIPQFRDEFSCPHCARALAVKEEILVGLYGDPVGRYASLKEIKPANLLLVQIGGSKGRDERDGEASFVVVAPGLESCQ
jgi:FPC/CPF motif-containing protein YcgG